MREFIETIVGENIIDFTYSDYDTLFVKKEFNSYYLFFFLNDKNELIELKERIGDIFRTIKKNTEIYQVDMDKNITCIFCLCVSEQEYYELEQTNQITDLSKTICLVEEDLNYFKKNVLLYTNKMEEFAQMNTKSFDLICDKYITKERFQSYKRSSKDNYEYDFLISLFIKIPFLSFQRFLPKDGDGYQSVESFIKEKYDKKSIDKEYIDKVSKQLEDVLDDEDMLYAWIDELVQAEKDENKQSGEEIGHEN